MNHLGKNVVIVGALLAAGFLIAWLRFRPYLGNEGRYTDGAQTYDVSAADEVRYAVWDVPELLPGDVNTDESERRPALSPDGRFLVFAAGERGLGADLYVAELVGGVARDPRPLDLLNTGADEWAPAFSGSALYFASDRSGTSGGLDLWRAPYDLGEFGRPERVNGGINSSADDTDPAPVPGSEALVFASNRRHDKRVDYDLYLARPERLEPPADGTEPGRAWRVAPIEELNSRFDEREPALTADGKTLFFASERTEAGDFDIYRSAFGDGAWVPPEPLHGVNTELSERGPSPSRDGFVLSFHVEEDEEADLYTARSLELFRTPGRPVGWRELLIVALLLLTALLATLAKYWDQLEVVYKCFLVSLVVHLLLMWWFRDVYPEGGEYELRGDSNRIRVRYQANPSGPSAANTEQGGELQVAREAAEAAREREVERASELAQAQESTPAPSAAALARAEAADVRAPEQTPAEARKSATARTEVETRETAEAFERLAAEAPELALQAGEAQRRADSAAESSAERGEAPVSNLAEVAPGAAALAPSAEAALPAGPRAERVELAPARKSALADVTVERPAEEFARFSDAARELAVEAGFRDEPVPRGEREAQRAQASAPDVLEAKVAAAAEPIELERSLSARDAGVDPLAGRMQPEVAREVRPSASVELEDDARESFERLAQDTAVKDELLTPTPETGARPDARLEARSDPDRREAPAARETARMELTPRRFEPAPRRDEEPFPAAEMQVAKADVTPRERALPDVALDDRPSAVAPLIGADEEPPRAEVWEAGITRDLADSLVTLSAPERDARRSDEPTPKRWKTEARTPDAGPSFRPLVAADVTREFDAPESVPRWEHTPYRSRTGEQKLRAIEVHGGSEETEAAVAAGLAYLARKQDRQGFWGSPEDAHEKYGHVAVGKTGLALLAFMGAGHTQQSGTEYSRVVKKAIDFLLAVQEDRSGHFGYTASYSHAIATYALAECYALTRDARLEGPLQRAVAQILRHQMDSSDSRFHGGWGYYYPDERTFDRWPRASVTAWQVMALESARLGELSVPDEAFEDARTFLVNAWDRRRGAYRYSHDPVRLDSFYPILPGSTPASLFALSLLGEDIASPRYGAARAFVLERAPRSFEHTTDDAFVFEAQGNLYFWYYGTLAMFRVEGNAWEGWNEAMKDALIPAQEDNGSWDPISVYNQYTGDDDGDRSYTTAMCVLTLEVYYRYFTPLLKVK